MQRNVKRTHANLFLRRCKLSRPDDAFQKHFSWFSDWIQKVQRNANLIDLIKRFPTCKNRLRSGVFSCARMPGFLFFFEKDRTYLLACLPASIQPRTSLSKCGGDSIHFFIRLLYHKLIQGWSRTGLHTSIRLHVDSC